MTVYINKLPCVRDAQGSEAGAKHGSEADPEAARPERSEGNALIYSNNNLKHQTMKKLNLKEGSVYSYTQYGLKQAVIYDCLTEKPITISNPSGQYHRFLLPIAKDGDKKICEVIELTDQEAYEQIYMFPKYRWYSGMQSKRVQ